MIDPIFTKMHKSDDKDVLEHIIDIIDVIDQQLQCEDNDKNEIIDAVIHVFNCLKDKNGS